MRVSDRALLRREKPVWKTLLVGFVLILVLVLDLTPDFEDEDHDEHENEGAFACFYTGALRRAYFCALKISRHSIMARPL